MEISRPNQNAKCSQEVSFLSIFLCYACILMDPGQGKLYDYFYAGKATQSIRLGLRLGLVGYKTDIFSHLFCLKCNRGAILPIEQVYRCMSLDS